MDEDRETPRSHKSSSSPNSAQLEASRSTMPPLSPLPGRGGTTYTDRCGGDTSDLSRAILAVSGEDSLAKMNYVAKFLQSMPGSNSRDYAADLARLEKYASPNWRNAGAMPEKSDVRGGREFATDGGFSMEGGRDELGRARIPVDSTYYISRSPLRMVGNNSKPGGVQSEMMDGRNDVDGEVLGDRRHHHHHHQHQFQNFLKSQHASGYDLDMLDQAESRYHHHHQHHSPYANKFSVLQPPSTSLEDNPLAAMVQKFAVSSNGEYSSSPLKTAVAPPVGASLYPERGLPKKRRFRSDVIFPTSMSYGLPPSLHGSGAAMAVGGLAKGPGHPDVFICHICSFVATSNEDFKAHMSIHYDYQCPQCTYSSRTEGRLKRHIKDFHGASDSTAGGEEENPDGRTAQKTNQPKKFKCRQCHFISYSREEHWRHIKVHIKKEKQLKCIHCPFVTEFKHHLEYHIRNHNNSKPYKCGKCNYTCVNKSMLNSHMKSHTNVYQFRCASCKYATKYSHSLKLHLVNKKHVPAVVLNPDGSLPTDGSGSFELISKRGPPRGPRGPRKSKSMSGDASPPALLPIFPTNSSPIMSLGQGNEYPWIPVQNGKQPLNGVSIPGALPPLKAALLSTAGTIPNPSLGYPLNILSQLSSSITPPAVSYPSDRMDAVGYASDRMDAAGYHLDRMDVPVAAASVPCGFCPAAFSSLALLADHVKMEHAQKLGGFGVKLEARSPTPEPGTLSYPDHTSVCEKKLNAEDAICHVTVSNSKPESAVFSSRNVDQPTPNRGEIEIDAKKDSVTETSEIPLDLSSKNFDDVKRSVVKRTAFDAEEEDTSSTVSLSVAAASRKRSRKGKACKLDELSLKLQDHWKEEDGLLEGSESSSLDDECLSGVTGSGGGVGRETERKFSEVGCGTTSSPPPPPPALPVTANLNDSGSWSWRKESSPQYSDADSSDQHCREKKSKAETHRGQQSLRQNELSDQEPVSDNSNGSEGFDTSHAKPSTAAAAAAAARKPADNGYYTCNYCDMGFRDNVTHFLHMGYHTYDDPFKCNKCGHRSSDAVDFFVHMARVAHTQ